MIQKPNSPASSASALPCSVHSISRRAALKVLGASLLAAAPLAGLSRLAGAGLADASGEATPSRNGPLPAGDASTLTQPFALPPLPFAPDALQPAIGARTMEIHHGKHHQAYVSNANAALQAYPKLQSLTAGQLLRNLDEVPESIRAAVRNNVGGHANHSFFWPLLAAPHSTPARPFGSLRIAIEETFDGFEAFTTQFNQAASSRFGSGWAWLAWQDGKLVILSTANQDSPLSLGARPIIGLDVWEHAYYLDYQNRRVDYITAFWSALNWTQAEANYTAAQKAS